MLLIFKQQNDIYYAKNQQDATLAVLFISNCKITLHVSDAFCVHDQEYYWIYIFPDPWHTPVAASTVVNTPDDGRRKRSKHVE